MTSSLEHTSLLHRRGSRLSLEFQPGEVQSQMDLDDPDQLVLRYARAMMCFVLFKPRARHIVMVGLGGGSLAKFCHRYLPYARITVLELRADVIALRERFAVPPDDERFRIIHADAADYMARLQNSADVLLLDGFDHDGLPSSLTTARFYADCRRALRPDGLLVANIFSYDPRYPILLSRLRQRFQGCLCQFNGIAGNNRIVFALKAAADRPTPALNLLRRVARHQGLWPGLGFGLINRLLARWLVARLRGSL
ncbi:fused MFS/spermidine synthase [Massilia sp. YIM B04103]|uniref:fused MFS/spermidine synthase n=1 Tax=Massilia sp. YIM B04103 TaxID=2963106 RepID=UPI00210D734B|nr:fused MFS/spermidine synthase [Massilia sp. YIM B04103]